MNAITLPVLADSRALRLAGFAGLYTAQGLPWGLFMVALPTWLASRGHSSTEVGVFLATVSFPWTLKLLAGPIMDRFSYLEMGRRRPWVLGAQAGILLGCLVLSLGVDSFTWILAVGFIINLSAAVQDVAVDGLAIDVLPENERAQTNAFMFGGQILGISSASAGGAWLLTNYGLSVVAWVMALCVALIACIPLLLRERQGERLLPWTEGGALARSHELQETEWRKIFGDLIRVLFLPMSLLLIVVKFGDRVAAGIFGAVMPVLTTQELGFSATFYPEWSAIAGMVAAVLGVLVAPYIDRVTAQRALFWGLLFKVLVIVGSALLVDYWVNPNLLIVLYFVYGFTGQWLTIATISLFMNLCATRIAASQFAVYMAMSNLALSAGSALLGPLDALLAFHEIFYVIAAIDLAMLGLFLWFNLEKHKARLGTIFGTDT
jgi:MFS transporter, PAT family, beta-lactamase induction signal transducer AmpG